MIINKLQKLINNPSEYFFKIIILFYQFFSFPIYRLLFKNFGYSSFIHPLASIRNHKNIILGNNVIINRNVVIWATNLKTGNNIQINPNTCIYGNITIGNDVMIAPNCTLAGGNHGIMNNGIPMIMQECTTKGGIVIEDDVWIGSNCAILDGVRIGHGAVIGAGSVVTKNIPPMAIVVGAPMKIIRSRHLCDKE